MIYGKVGRLGHGKTMRMVVDALALAKLRGAGEGRCWIASNIGIVVPEGWSFFQLSQDEFSPALAALMAEARRAKVGLVVAVDEIDEVWGSHDWQNMRKSDRRRIKMSRKYGCDMFYTAQYVDQIEKSIRNVTEEVELVRAWPEPTLRRREHCGRRGKPHNHDDCAKRPFLIYGQRFRPAAVREIIGTPDKDRRLGRTWHLYRRAHELLYDTDEIVESPDVEALCGKHAKEERESRCPRCHPEQSIAGLASFVVAASQPASAGGGSPPEVDAA